MAGERALDRSTYKRVPGDRLEAELRALECFLGGARPVYHMDRDTADAVASLLAELLKLRDEET